MIILYFDFELVLIKMKRASIEELHKGGEISLNN